MSANRLKNLLTQLRSTEAAATLTRAQSELAQEYGFRSWADLKAEVDRSGHHQGGELPAPPASWLKPSAWHGDRADDRH